jgi:hypothetical protein
LGGVGVAGSDHHLTRDVELFTKVVGGRFQCFGGLASRAGQVSEVLVVGTPATNDGASVRVDGCVVDGCLSLRNSTE